MNSIILAQFSNTFFGPFFGPTSACQLGCGVGALGGGRTISRSCAGNGAGSKGRLIGFFQRLPQATRQNLLLAVVFLVSAYLSITAGSLEPERKAYAGNSQQLRDPEERHGNAGARFLFPRNIHLKAPESNGSNRWIVSYYSERIFSQSEIFVQVENDSYGMT